MKNMLRVATLDTAHAIDAACFDVESAVGLRVRAEFQEIEGGSLIIELQLGDETQSVSHSAQLAHAVHRAVSSVEVLNSWEESTLSETTPLLCSNVLGVGYETLPEVAQRALSDDLPTAKWERMDSSWHLAVPALCGGKAIVGMANRRGYSFRFSAHDAAALESGLAS